MAPIPELLTCPDGVRAETLSTLRDELLPAAEAERLRAHAASCPACQARLAQHNDLRRALLAQPELEPGERIVAGVRARLGRRSTRRQLMSLRATTHGPLRWSGLGALAAAAAVLLLFVYVLGTRPATTAPMAKGTPSPSVTATTTPAPSPTVPVQISPPVDVTTAWGATTGTVINPTFDGKHFLVPATITADGRYLVGNEASLPSGTVPPTSQPGLLEIATRHFQTLGTGTAFSSVNCCSTDGRYYVGSDSDAPQQACGVCHLRLWSYDSSTGTVREIASGESNGELLGWLLSNGVVVYQTQSSAGLQEVTLATGAVRTLVPWPAGGDVVLLAFTWPYLVYAVRPATGTVAHVRDLSTGQDIALHQLDAIAGSISFPRWAAVVGDTLYASVGSQSETSGLTPLSTVYALDHLLDPTSPLKVLAAYGGDLGPMLGANARVIAFQFAVWDRAEERFVDFNSLGENPQALSGNYLLVTGLFHAGTPGRVTLYDTSRLPVRMGT